MSALPIQTKGLELIADSAAPIADVGTAKLNYDGSTLKVSLNGGAFASAGGTVIPAEGTALTDATATINPASDSASEYTLPAAVPLTANRVLTLGTTGSPITNSIVTVVKRGAGAFTLTVKDDAATTLYTFTSGSTNQAANFYYTGTHYAFLSFVYLAA